MLGAREMTVTLIALAIGAECRKRAIGVVPAQPRARPEVRRPIPWSRFPDQDWLCFPAIGPGAPCRPPIAAEPGKAVLERNRT